MTDPRRFHEDDPALAPGLRAALDDARDDRATDAEVAAIAAAVSAAIASGGGGGGGGGAAAAATKASGGAATLAGQIVLGIGALGLAGYAAWSSYAHPDPGVSLRAAEREVVERAAAVASGALPAEALDAGLVVPLRDPGALAPLIERREAEAAAREEAGDERARIDEPEPTPRDEVEGPDRVLDDPPLPDPEEPEPPSIDELALLRDARAALATDPGSALAITERMRAAPAPAWAEERERVAIEALHRLGRDREAEARFAAFVADHPRSAYRARLEELLEQAP